MRKIIIDKTIHEIQNWIRDYVKNANADGVIVCVSGGVDSAVILALCVNALGKKKITALILPCQSQPQDEIDAKLVLDMFEVKYYRIDLTPIYLEFLKVTGKEIKGNMLSKANIKPRLRMITAYYIGQSLENHLVVGTGNRTEDAIGYFTKYGDGGVDFLPIGDLYKCEVRKLAKKLKIPELIINKPPSAGLWEGQTDEGEIGFTYDELDEIVYKIDHNKDLTDIDQEKLLKVQKMMKASEHKIKEIPKFIIKK